MSQVKPSYRYLISFHNSLYTAKRYIIIKNTHNCSIHIQVPLFIRKACEYFHPLLSRDMNYHVIPLQASTQVPLLMSTLDEDGDGQVSFQEFQGGIKEFLMDPEDPGERGG